MVERWAHRCSATRTDGEPCERYAIAGGTVCPAHGGAAGQVKQASKRRLVEQQALRELRDVEVDPIGDPIEAFREIVAEARALKRHLAAKVAALEATSGQSFSFHLLVSSLSQ